MESIDYYEEDSLTMTSCIFFNFYFNAIWIDDDPEGSEEGMCLWVLYEHDRHALDYGRHRMF